MQNRRIAADDARGMGEWLDEKDENGFGIRVSATYYIDLFNKKQRISRQRLIQQRTDEPPQYFFNFNFSASYPSGKESKLADEII
jgi:hypothetical protein